MAVMAADTAFTREDLDALPPDGRRHELLDGAFLVTPSPGFAHQDVLMRLIALLRPNLPEGLVLLAGPFDVVLSDRTVVVPDLLVAPRSQFTARDLPGAPLLAVEIRSPSTALIDRTTKRHLYEQAGVPSYWLVDPVEPALTVLELVDGAYAERAHLTGDATLALSSPYPVELSAQALRPA
jgi:Uma2 family endonuclease